MTFKPKTIEHIKEYGSFPRIITVSIYTKRKHIDFEIYKKSGLIATGVTYVRYENNPVFKTEARLHTILCAN